MTTTTITETFECVTRNTVTGEETTRTFPTREQAVEQAKTLREWNPRDWPCGRNLDIVVRTSR